MNWLQSLWRRSKPPVDSPETTTLAHRGERCASGTISTAHQGERLFSVFEDESEPVLLQQCQEDLAAWGFDSFQCRQKAKRILENAKVNALAETGRSGRADQATSAVVVEEFRSPDACSRDGVTPEDSLWYWSLPALARAVMQEFDGELREAMWFVCHASNLCIEDLEQDLRRRLPTFGKNRGASSEDAPLPWELMRRVATFLYKETGDEVRSRAWVDRVRQASSMNALIREEIRAGRL